MPPVSRGRSATANAQQQAQSSSKSSSKAGLSVSTPLESLNLILTDQRYFATMGAMLIIAETLLCLFIIRYVKYTEIDFSTYMQQVAMFLRGERDYSQIRGDSGPLVYPAGFLYIYSVLYAVTERGSNLRAAQYIFAALYVVTMGLVFAILRRCNTASIFVFIRLHSLYVLRMFNDCFAMAIFYVALFVWTTPLKTRRTWWIGTVVFGLALSIKMNLLLFLPGLVYILAISLGLVQMLVHMSTIAIVQFIVGLPFSSSLNSLSLYFNTAFDFHREFLWEWTVNWRWIGQAAFESQEFSGILLIGHFTVLILMGLNWSDKERARQHDRGFAELVTQTVLKPFEAPVVGQPSADYVCTILFTSNLIGVLFSRSLHYQFYTWYAHQIVFLLWHTPFDVYQRLGIFAAIEFGWETFPSTQESSLGLTFAHAFTLVGVFYGQSIGSGREHTRMTVKGDNK
ncbi:dolichyl-P-Man:Man(5)GlcNAc(2)-PP-dolichol alpha-1,3-mannosyltransferase [Microbotryomycetes sp. JL221]|nr:dolichyl-P-Man:Man(5)GlcNAc(2)-PP-dolichol alpha-1,3-mannosyltransferase [Microbotryomycetes sp. JL221]